MGELILDALREIAAHPLRSLLTLSGIVFGAASLVSMTSLARGLQTMAYEDLRNLGFPRSYFVRDRGPRSDARSAAALQAPGLRLGDLAALRAMPGVESARGLTTATDRIVEGPRERRSVRVEGVDVGYLEQRSFRITGGRGLSPLEVGGAARVAVVGVSLLRDLFGDVDPIGREIKMDGIRFRVIGALEPMRLGMVPANVTSYGRRVYVPYTYLSRYYDGEGRIGRILVTARPDADFASVLQAGTALVRQRHGGADDFEISNEAADVMSDLAMADGVLGGWNGVMLAISIVTLLVGGIGLFSVLLISVRERVREIGVRKALGADDTAILQLFLAESLTLAALGAVLGVAGGAGLIVVTKLIGAHFGKAFVIPISVPGVLTAVGFALVVGLAFGWYPARRAARLDPIQAMNGL
jgi:putative ABC transport system permease protein